MSAAVAVTPTSGNIIHATTAVEVAVTGASSNDSTAYDVTKYPTEPAIVYYLKWAATDQPTLISPQFTPSEAGAAEWHDVIIPGAGSWTLTLNYASDDTIAATASVTVS